MSVFTMSHRAHCRELRGDWRDSGARKALVPASWLWDALGHRSPEGGIAAKLLTKELRFGPYLSHAVRLDFYHFSPERSPMTRQIATVSERRIRPLVHGIWRTSWAA